MKRQYVFIKIKVQFGEHSAVIKDVFEIGARRSLEKFSKDWAANFYPNKSHSDGDDHYYNGGEVAVRLLSYQGISKEQYEVLNKFL